MNKKDNKDLNKSEESSLTGKNFQKEKKLLDTPEVKTKKNKKIKLNHKATLKKKVRKKKMMKRLI